MRKGEKRYTPCFSEEFPEGHSKLLFTSHWVELNHDATLNSKELCEIRSSSNLPAPQQHLKTRHMLIKVKGKQVLGRNRKSQAQRSMSFPYAPIWEQGKHLRRSLSFVSFEVRECFGIRKLVLHPSSAMYKLSKFMQDALSLRFNLLIYEMEILSS